jgi:hypothetical protein
MHIKINVICNLLETFIHNTAVMHEDSRIGMRAELEFGGI